MTPSHIADRNRANAAKSTGPKTRAGKAASSKHATRHGATGAPDPSRVASWLAVILGRPEVTPRDLLPADAAGDLALTLALSEARLAAAEDALAEFEAGLETPSEPLPDPATITGPMIDELLGPGVTPSDRRSGRALLKIVARLHRNDTSDGGRRHRLLTRYAKEARSARSRAIAAWSSHIADSPNQTGAGS